MPKRQRTCSTCAGELSTRGRCRSCAFDERRGAYLIPSSVPNPSHSDEAASGAHEGTHPNSSLELRSGPGHQNELGNEDDDHNRYHAMNDNCMQSEEQSDGPHDPQPASCLHVDRIMDFDDVLEDMTHSDGANANTLSYHEFTMQMFDGPPPLLKVASHLDAEVLVYAMPHFDAEHPRAIQRVMYQTGCIRVANDEDEEEDNKMVYICNCCEEGETAWQLACMFHEYARCTSDIPVFQCTHTRTLLDFLDKAGGVWTVMGREIMTRDGAPGTSCTLRQLTWKSQDDDSAPAAWDLSSAALCPQVRRQRDRHRLYQVGSVGDPTCTVGLVIGQKCQVCATRKHCYHIRYLRRCALQDDHDVDEDSDIDPNEDMTADAKSCFRMPLDRFDSIMQKYANSEGTGLQLHCSSRRKIPFDPLNQSAALASARYRRSVMDWNIRHGLKDLCSHPSAFQADEQNAPSLCSCESCNQSDAPTQFVLAADNAILFHAGGVVPNVKVMCACVLLTLLCSLSLCVGFRVTSHLASRGIKYCWCLVPSRPHSRAEYW